MDSSTKDLMMLITNYTQPGMLVSWSPTGVRRVGFVSYASYYNSMSSSGWLGTSTSTRSIDFLNADVGRERLLGPLSKDNVFLSNIH